MAKLIGCKECGHEVSKAAKVCPKCGCPSPNPSHVSAGVVVLTLVAAFGVISVGMRYLIEDSAPPQATTKQIPKIAPAPKHIYTGELQGHQYEIYEQQNIIIARFTPQLPRRAKDEHSDMLQEIFGEPSRVVA